MHGNIRFASTWIVRSLNLDACRRILESVGLSSNGRLKELQDKIVRQFKDKTDELLGLLKKDELVALCNLTQLTRYDGYKHTVCPIGHPNTLRLRLNNILDELFENRANRHAQQNLDEIISDLFVDEFEDEDPKEQKKPESSPMVRIDEDSSDPGVDVKRWLKSKNLFDTDVADDSRCAVEKWMQTAKLEKNYKTVPIVDIENFEPINYQPERFADLSQYLESLLVKKLEKSPDPLDGQVLKPMQRNTLAFYAPLHYWEDWGIYLHADGIISQAKSYQDSLKNNPLFSFGLICHFVVFETFHHEFYHHQVESFAIASEILLNSISTETQSVYRELSSKQRAHEVEEGMANAYAYNALGMANRLSHDSKHLFISIYQRAVKEGWKSAPAGYNEAGAYLGGKHIQGNANLIQKALNTDLLGAALLARNVMPQGHSVMVHKSKIPLYLAGSDQAMEELLTNVPAIREAASQLWLPYDLTNLNNEANRIKDEWRKKHQKSEADDDAGNE